MFCTYARQRKLQIYKRFTSPVAGAEGREPERARRPDGGAGRAERQREEHDRAAAAALLRPAARPRAARRRRLTKAGRDQPAPRDRHRQPAAGAVRHDDRR